MSQRVKRPNRSEDGSVPVKRRKRTAAEEEEAATLVATTGTSASSGTGAVVVGGPPLGGSWQPPRSNDLKSIYNRTTTEAPAELFRKDLISAMKLPDSEPLASDEYWVIVDQWKQEWERGVQVPVNPDSLPEPLVSVKPSSSKGIRPHTDFKLPKNKYIRITKDDNFQPEEHFLSHAPAKSEAACSYDLDECDVAWLKIFNAERASGGLGPFSEEQLERVIERLELCCWDKIQSILRNEEGLGIEYDENVICDVCRSPDSEEGNEMVFCDSCNICVHQACYGITRIPEGQWLCCTCNIGKRPECVLCPNKGGAMKCLRTGQKWAHVSCALWIPEVSIGCVEKMEPITKVSSIPPSRWALICVLCRERVGACIQCSVKTCKTAYHVTCAFKHGLEMRAIIEDENADDGVKLRSYCEKHSKSSKKEKSICSGSEDDDVKRKKRKDMTSEEKNQARAIRLQEIEAEFFKHVSIKDVSMHFNIESDSLQYIYNYWKLKRKAGFNKPLLPPKSEDIDVLSHKREQADLEKMKMFVQLRQDLERVRNLCYMVSRREKLSRTFFRMREQTFHKQAAVLDSAPTLPPSVIEAVIEANHGPSIYDRLYSHNEAEDHTNDFETILARISGKSPPHSGDEINGLFKNNPYKKMYNGSYSKRRSSTLYGSSMSEATSGDEKPKDNKENQLHTDTEDEKPSSSLNKKSKLSRKQNNVSKVLERKRRKKPENNKLDSSTDEDIKPNRSRLSQIDRELESVSESDDLIPIRTALKDDCNKKTAKSMSSIYSDTDSSDDSTKNYDKSSNATNDSQSKFRTKAAVKDFTHKPSSKNNKVSPEIKKTVKSEENKEKQSKKKDYVSSDLIVPQRQAAKKATENLKTTTISRAKDHPVSVEDTLIKSDDKNKQKTKPKLTKDASKEEHMLKEKDAIKDVKEKKKDKDVKSQPMEVFDFDKEDKTDLQELLYVPQRQAAKKAAEHIKSGLGKPAVTAIETQPTETQATKKESDVKKLESKKSEIKKETTEPVKPAKVSESKRKSSTNTNSSSNSSSSSSSSSDTSSSSSTDSDDELSEKLPQQPRSESSPKEVSKRSNAKDWPFLDKGARSAATSGSSSSSDSSPSSSPSKKTSSPIPSSSRADSPSRAAIQTKQQQPQQAPTKRSPDKKQPATAVKREEQSRSRGRGRGRPPRTSNSGERIRDTNVRNRDLSDGQRLSVEGERTKGGNRKGKPTSKDEISVEKETQQLLSPVRKTDKKLKSSEIGNLEKEILERKADKEGPNSKNKSSMFERLFGTPDKKDKEERPLKSEKSDKIKKDLTKVLDNHNKPGERPLIAPEKLTIPDKNNFIDKSNDHKLEKQDKEDSTLSELPDLSEKCLKQVEKVPKTDSLIKSPNKELKDQIEKKLEHKDDNKQFNKKLPNKNKSINDIFANKLSSSDMKENKLDLKKPPTPKQSKTSDEITLADKIVDDHLLTHKAKDLYNRQTDAFHGSSDSDLTKTLLSDLDSEKKNSLKPAGLTNQVLQNRSIFSPQPPMKDDFLDLDLDDMGIPKDDEIIKTSLSWNFSSNNIIREDSKEDSARETLNLVEKLRMGLSKKSGGSEMDEATTSNETEPHLEFSDQSTEKDAKLNVQLKVQVTEVLPCTQFSNINKDYNYLNSSTPTNEPKEIPSQQTTDHPISIQGDERWIPPNENYTTVSTNENFTNIPTSDSYPNLAASDNFSSVPIADSYPNVPTSESYPNVQAVDPRNYMDSVVPPINPQYLEQYGNNTNSQDHHKKHLNSLPGQLEARLQEEVLKSQSPLLPERLDRRISQTPLIDPSSMDCMNSPMPYTNIHPQAKWADCEIIPNRRSSSSSASSTSSSSRRDEDESQRIPPDIRIVNHASLDMATYLPSQVPQTYQPNTMDTFGGYPVPDASCYPVSLFNSSNPNTQLPFPPVGPGAMYPPTFGAAFPTSSHSMPSAMAKPLEDSVMHPSSTCTAAFTSSQPNMAFTAAMVNMPPSAPKPIEQQLDEQLLGPPTVETIAPPLLTPTTSTEEVVPSPALSNSTPTANSTLPSPSTSLKSNSSTGKKSPSKPTRTSARVSSQMMNKSPAKSPGKSPRQENVLKQSGPGRGRGDSKKGSGKSGAARGTGTMRGRGKGRGRGR